jgi:hypothetical protein
MPSFTRRAAPLACFIFPYSEFRNIPSCRFIPLPGADEIKRAELLNSEYSWQSSCRHKQKWVAVRLKPRASRGTRIMSLLVLQSRTGVGTNCKSAFPGARTQGGIRATDLSRLSFNIPSFSPKKRRHGAGSEPLLWSTWLNQGHQRRARKRRGPHAGDDSTSHHAGRGLPGTVARPSFDCGKVHWKRSFAGDRFSYRRRC